jgi:hypothetical protein
MHPTDTTPPAAGAAAVLSSFKPSSLGGVWADEGLPPGVSPYFDPQGFWDVCGPLVLAMCLLGAAFQALEAWLFEGMAAEAAEQEEHKGGRKVTHVFCTGVVARVALLLLPWAPTRFARTRWDWVCMAPTVYETLAHVYHWADTTAKLKWSLLGHHAAVLVVVWPLIRCVRAFFLPPSDACVYLCMSVRV